MSEHVEQATAAPGEKRNIRLSESDWDLLDLCVAAADRDGQLSREQYKRAQTILSRLQP